MTVRQRANVKSIRRRKLNRCSNRRGAGALEFVIAFPAVVIIFFGGLQMSLTSSIRNTVSAAVHEASRCCEKEGTLAETVTVVNQYLNVHGFGIGPGVRLVLQDDTGAIQSAGDGSLTSSTLAAPPPAGTCRAVLIVQVSATPAPNLLSAFCVDFSGRRFESSSVVTLDPECS